MKSKNPPLWCQNAIIVNEKSDDTFLIVTEKLGTKIVSYFVASKNCSVLVGKNPKPTLEFDRSTADMVKPVPGFKKFFWITNTGVLISRRTKKILSQTLSKTGYWTHASKIGGRKGRSICLKIHRLVASAFSPNPENKPFVNHIDGIKTNNHFSNLEWVTSKENMVHASATGLLNPRKGEDHVQAKLTKDQATEIRRLKTTHTQHKLADMFGVTRKTIYSVVNMLSYV